MANNRTTNPPVSQSQIDQFAFSACLYAILNDKNQPPADLEQVRAVLEVRAESLEAAGKYGEAEIVRGAIAKVGKS